MNLDPEHVPSTTGPKIMQPKAKGRGSRRGFRSSEPSAALRVCVCARCSAGVGALKVVVSDGFQTYAPFSQWFSRARYPSPRPRPTAFPPPKYD